MEIVSRHGTDRLRQSWHDRASACGDNALGAHTIRLGCAHDKALRAQSRLS